MEEAAQDPFEKRDTAKEGEEEDAAETKPGGTERYDLVYHVKK